MNDVKSQDITYPPKKKRKKDYNILDSLKCPITKDIFVHPYILVQTGITYEWSAIKKWLHENNTCPLTNIKLDSKKISKNLILDTLIEEHMDNNLINKDDIQIWRNKRVLSRIEFIISSWDIFPKDYILQYIKENNALLNKQEFNLLTLSVQHGHDTMTKYLIDYWNIDLKLEVELTVKDRYFYPIKLKGPIGDIHLFLAATLGYEEIVELFLNESNTNPNYYNCFTNQTLLSISSWYGDIGIVEKLLTHPKIDLTSLLISGQPQWVDALSNCAFHGYTPILNRLLQCQEVDPNCQDSQLSDQVPLIIAIERQNYEIIKRLLECPNINTDIEEYFSGDPLLHFSIRTEDYQLLEILLDCSKFDLNQKNDDQLTILELIFLRDDSISLRILLDKIMLRRI